MEWPTWQTSDGAPANGFSPHIGSQQHLPIVWGKSTLWCTRGDKESLGYGDGVTAAGLSFDFQKTLDLIPVNMMMVTVRHRG